MKETSNDNTINNNNGIDNATQTAIADAMAGVIGSVISTIAFYPLDVRKTKLQAGIVEGTSSNNDNDEEEENVHGDGEGRKKKRRKDKEKHSREVNNGNYQNDDTSTTTTTTTLTSTIRKIVKTILTDVILSSFHGVHYKVAHSASSSFAYFFLHSFIQSRYYAWHHRSYSSHHRRHHLGGGGGDSKKHGSEQSNNGNNNNNNTSIGTNPSATTKLLLSALAAIVNTLLTLPLDVLSAKIQTRTTTQMATKQRVNRQKLSPSPMRNKVPSTAENGNESMVHRISDRNHDDNDDNYEKDDDGNNDHYKCTMQGDNKQEMMRKEENHKRRIMDEAWDDIIKGDRTLWNNTATKNNNNNSDNNNSYDDENNNEDVVHGSSLNSGNIGSPGCSDYDKAAEEEEEEEGDETNTDAIGNGTLIGNKPKPNLHSNEEKKDDCGGQMGNQTMSDHSTWAYKHCYTPSCHHCRRRRPPSFQKSDSSHTAAAHDHPDIIRHVKMSKPWMMTMMIHGESFTSQRQSQHDHPGVQRTPLRKLSAFWKGLFPSILLCANPSVHYTVYDVVKSVILRRKIATMRNGISARRGGGCCGIDNDGNDEKTNEKRLLEDSTKAKAKLTMMEAFVIGLIAKFVATVITYPLIRAKVMLMVSEEEEEEAEAEEEEQDDDDVDTPRTTATTTISKGINHIRATAESHHSINTERRQNGPSFSRDCKDAKKKKSRATMLQLIWSMYQQHGIVGGLYKGCRLQLLHTVLKSALLMMVRERINDTTRRLILSPSSSSSSS